MIFANKLNAVKSEMIAEKVAANYLNIYKYGKNR